MKYTLQVWKIERRGYKPIECYYFASDVFGAYFSITQTSTYLYMYFIYLLLLFILYLINSSSQIQYISE